MTRIYSLAAALVTALTIGAIATPVGAQAAQSHAYDPSARLREVLPADVAERVLARIAQARSRGLPTQALERTAIRGGARNVPAADIERAVGAQAERLERSRDALSQASNRRPANEEIEAGAEAIRMGVDGKAVSELAKSAPSGRSLAVPLHVLGSLVERELPSDQAIAAVLERLNARATDAQIAQLPEQVTTHPGGKPELTGRDLAGTKRPGTAGAPAGRPANAGTSVRPTVPGSPRGKAPPGGME